MLSLPYRPPNTAHTSITPGLPLLLAFADFARSNLTNLTKYQYDINSLIHCYTLEQKYWSKDIIFLVTDQEQLGVQAFLEAYHGDEGNIYD